MIEAAISLILRRRKYIMLRNLFILLTAMFMGLVYYKFSTIILEVKLRVKEFKNWIT